MAFADLHWFSHTISKQVGTYILIPDGAKPPFATFYLLHGLSDDHTIWHRRTRIESYVEKLPLMVVMPDGFRGFYTRADAGMDYARYIGVELVEMIERTFPAKRSAGARCIGGLSMGGYGALRLALGYPGRFASANSHSGALMHGSRTGDRPFGDWAEGERIFGKKPAGTDHDLLDLARRAKTSRKLPKLLIDCGTEDFLLKDNRSFHAGLKKLGVTHTYREFPGTHNWDYWDLHVREALAFHAANLKLKPAK